MKRIVVGAGLLVALVALAAVAVGGVGAAQPDDGGETNASFGAEISSFMQASSAEAEGEVEDGMFQAGLNRANSSEERQAIVERHQERLEERQQRLQQRRAEISAADGAGVKDVALATHVDVGAQRLERSANGTARAAETAGLDVESLDEIRRNASELRGQEVAELARGMAGGPPGERGPPSDVPGANNSDVEARRGNGSGGQGPPDAPGNDDPGNGPGQGDEAREGDRGSGDDNGGDSGEGNPGESGGNGPPDDGGNGDEQGNAAGEAPGNDD